MLRWIAKTGIQFLLVAVICFVTSHIAAIFYLSTHNWFGSGDLVAFRFWLTPFCGLIGVSNLSFIFLTERRSLLLRVPLGIVIGALLGFIWTFFVATVLGPWFNAFSFPVLYFWMIGGALSLPIPPIWGRPERLESDAV